jgi:excisionase family DNA binding protein
MMNKDRGEVLLTALEVAHTLHVNRSYAYKLLDQGKLPYTQIGKSRRVHPDDLHKFIRENRTSHVVGN